MDKLAGVLLEMGAGNADAAGLALYRDIEVAMFGDGLVELTDLVVLWQIRIVVVLAVKLGIGGDLAVDCQAGLHALLKGFPVQHRQHPGLAQTDRAHVGILLMGKLVWAGAKDLGLRLQAHMHLKSNNGFVLHGVSSRCLKICFESGLTRYKPILSIIYEYRYLAMAFPVVLMAVRYRMEGRACLRPPHSYHIRHLFMLWIGA